MHKACIALLLLAAGPAWADDDTGPINPERPSVATGSTTVGRGVVEVETGPTYTSVKGGSPALLDLPVTVRAGIGKGIELRYAAPLINFQGPATGIGDTVVGVKWNFFHNDTLSLGVVGADLIPTGALAFRAAGDQPFVLLAADLTTSKTTSLSFNVAEASSVDGASNSRFGQTSFAALFSKSATDRLKWFVEYSGTGPDRLFGQTNTAADTGVSYLLNNNTMVDAAILKGLSSRGTDWSGTVGYSVRFK